MRWRSPGRVAGAFVFALAAMLGATVAPMLAVDARAQEGVTVLNDAVRNEFPVGVTFTLSFTAAILLFRPSHSP